MRVGGRLGVGPPMGGAGGPPRVSRRPPAAQSTPGLHVLLTKFSYLRRKNLLNRIRHCLTIRKPV